MKDLKVWQKLALLGVVFMLPFAVVTWKMISSINKLGVEFARQELRGLDYYAPTLALVQDLQRHRALAAGWLQGDASFKEPLARNTADLEKAINQLDAVDQRLNGALRTTQHWSAWRAACRNLLSRTLSLSPDDSAQLHRATIASGLEFIAYLSDASNLTLDPDVDTYYLIHFLIQQGPELSEILAQTLALGVNVTTNKAALPAQYAEMNRLLILAEFLQSKVDDTVSRAFEFNSELRAAMKARTYASIGAVDGSLGGIRRMLDGPPAQTNAAVYISARDQGIDSIFEMEHYLAQSLHGLLNKRVENHQREVLHTLGWAAFLLLASCATGFLIMRDVTIALRKAVAVADRITTGDLAGHSVATLRKDEFGVLSRAFEQMITTLSALIGQVQKSGIQVNSSVTEIAATTKQQQATATEIAVTTTEIGATSKQIWATSRELVQTMNAVSAAADQSAILAENGHAGLLRMEETMRQVMEAADSIASKLAVLNEKAANINQVVTTIAKVAAQTNLLSFNAAIEAEKAGEYGRGFAVVALEIRRLADQTEVATRDIEQMLQAIQSAVSAGVTGMDNFSNEVRGGIRDVQQVGGELSQIIQRVQDLAPEVESLNEGMQAQADGAEQISEALRQLSEGAQQTVESLRQSSLTVEAMNEVSRGLHASISRFNLRIT